MSEIKKLGRPVPDVDNPREYIRREVRPIKRLAAIAQGRLIVCARPDGKSVRNWLPTPDQQLAATQTLVRKILPDLRQPEGTAGDILQELRFLVEALDHREPVAKDITPAAAPLEGKVVANPFEQDPDDD